MLFNFKSLENLDQDFIGTINTNPFSDTNNCIQVLPQVDFALPVTKNVSVKQCVLIRLYCNILSLVEKFLIIGPSTSCFLNCVVIFSVFFAASISMCQTFDR